jgi:N-acetylglucosaminyl-diphospho-decaprenol L-rhamnosyltransferase
MEVIVVDNDSHDGSAAMVQADFPEVTLVVPGKNTGYAGGNNLGFEIARGEWLLTLNPDTEVFGDTLDAAVAKLEQNATFGALGVRQVGVDGSTQHSVRGFPTFLGLLGEVTGLAKLAPSSRLGQYRLKGFNYDLEQAAPQPMGTFLLFRREALSAVGDPRKPFDAQFPIFFNEVDLLYRMQKAGWPCLYTPEVAIKHLGGESTKLVKKSMIWESHKSLGRFFEKHYRNSFTAPFLPLLRGLLALGALIRARGYHAGFKS